MNRIYLVVQLLLYVQLISCQNIMDNESSKRIENQLFINGKEIDIRDSFTVTLKDNGGKEYSIPINETFINISEISKSAMSYEITFEYANYKLRVDLYTKDIIPKERVIWVWSIESDTLEQKDERKCSLKFEYIETEIEILWPIEYCN